MPLKPFEFKQFSIAQDSCTHKVGTDGVLLGAWTNVSGTDTAILDVGTGSGLIAIMLAQRTAPLTRIDALDIGVKEVQQARENVQRSPWPEKIRVLHTPLQTFFPPEKYDLIVSNPPYFSGSLLPADQERSQARHTQQLSFEDLVKNAARLLLPHGRLAVILPCAEGLRFVDCAKMHHLYVQRQSAFRSRIPKPAERLLMELSFTPRRPQADEIVLYADGDEWSEQYRSLTRDFYRKA